MLKIRGSGNDDTGLQLHQSGVDPGLPGPPGPSHMNFGKRARVFYSQMTTASSSL